MEFVLVPAGKFMMGSADGDTDEKPIMGRTVGEQKRLVDRNNSVDPPRRLAGEGDEYPIYYVS